MGKDKDKGLTPKQINFCELYVSEDFFGNGVRAYLEAYKPTGLNAYNVAAAGASENLKKPNILKYINALLDAAGFNDAHADKQLYLVMTQNADFRAKVAALKEYNKLKRRVEAPVVNTTVIAEAIDYSKLDTNVLKAILAARTQPEK